ncbi:MAG: polyprenyl synthetase family protein [Planctomycetes bacterium]|nr:polyprenyl synthetase family protein [Planctomycetota bacterium]
MTDATAIAESMDLANRVQQMMADRLAGLKVLNNGITDVALLGPGKMLRTRLAARLVADDFQRVSPKTIERICLTTELIHTATLCHDDVIDNGLIRRARPTLWRASGPSAAVLIGDLLLCEAMALLLDIESGRYTRLFVLKIREVCTAEIEQELMLRGQRVDERTCLRIARGKTGPLFACIGHVCGGDDSDLCDALEEAGYCIGTAYQLADDLIDAVGDEQACGKTLGTDAMRRKFTLPQYQEEGPFAIGEHISRLCDDALDCVEAWPSVRDALIQFLVCDLQPIFDRHVPYVDVSGCGMRKRTGLR